MPLIQPFPQREKHLFLGKMGSGKSEATFSIAELLHQTQSPGRVHIIDTDEGAWRAKYGKYPHLNNIDIYPAEDWSELHVAVKQCIPNVQPQRGDWIILDLACKLWSWAQDQYVHEIFGKSNEAFFMDARRRMEEAKKKGGSALDGFRDWTIVKKIYFEMLESITKTKAHLILCTGAAAVDSETDDKETQTTFGNVGFKPNGEKSLAHGVHSCAYFYQKRGGINPVWAMKTAKDRGRPLQDCDVAKVFTLDPNTQQQVYTGGWAYQYLVGVAGWRIA